MWNSGASVLVMATLLVLGGCSQPEFSMVEGGSPGRGRAAIERYGCGSCHEIGGVPAARGQVGPSLSTVGRRQYLAGRLPNQPPNMIRWLRDPPSISPHTAMPKLGLSHQDALDIAAYLYSLSR